MKLINYFNVQLLFMVFLLISGKSFAQNELKEKNAKKQLDELLEYQNNKVFVKYVDYLLPFNYDNNPALKEKMAEILTRMSKGDTTSTQFIKILKTSVVNSQDQVLFQCKLRGNDVFIFGISNDGGENWLFTQTYSKAIQFSQIIKDIPLIDTTFAQIVDPRFGKRIHYEVGKIVSSFNYTDIYGTNLRYESLKGKIIVFNFWATSCGPCILEIPALNKLVEKYKEKNVVFIAPIIFANSESVKQFLLKTPFNYQIVLIDSKDYDITSFPTHIIINQELNVVEKFVGANPENIGKLEQMLNELSSKTKKSS